METVQVAVRCRPFNKRETGLGSECIVKMVGPKTILKDCAQKGGIDKEFTFDYSYWSFNKNDPHYADNQKVYQDLGTTVLENAWQGYNVCLFAYGQTGAGKSYSMVGYGEDRGIIPRAMQELFERVRSNDNPHVKYMVEASMMEIYNEKVRDLFNPKENPAGGLKVRDHPNTGPYVDNLSRNVVRTYAEISRLMDEGTAARTVAATQMNSTSSRAHTVFQIIFTTTVHDEETNKSTSKTSKINLVDLAGSERLAKTGASGDTMKEGIGINKSLTALGDCIQKLAKKSNSKKDIHIPYRNSVLTWLLKESLGGNSRTIMIAAISPASDNFEESLSTLRYADRAKQIKNKAIVNEDENAKVIRQLKEEIAKLRAQLEGSGGLSSTRGLSPSGGMTDKEREEYLRLKEQMKQNEEIISKMNMSWEEKMKQSEALALSRASLLDREAIEHKKKTIPHMVNLHKDRLMSECLSYFFPVGTIRLVQKNVQPPPGRDDIILQGLQIKPEHATVTNTTINGVLKQVTLTPIGDARCFVNGTLIKGETVINHSDRIVLGAHLVFRVVFPNHAAEDPGSQMIYDWDFAQKELSAGAMALLSEPKEHESEQYHQQLEAERKMQALQQEIEQHKKAVRAEQEAKQKEYERQLALLAAKREQEIAAAKKQIEASSHEEQEKALQRALAEREAELEKERLAAAQLHMMSLEAERKKQAELEAKLQEQMAETAKLHRRHDVEHRDRVLLEEHLMIVIPLVNEANAICVELQQPLTFNIKLQAHRQDDFTHHTDIFVHVANTADDTEVVWDVDTMTERVYEMREIYNAWLEHHHLIIPEPNPFHLDDTGMVTFGSARIYLQPCYYMMATADSVPIIDSRGETMGHLKVTVFPTPIGHPKDDVTPSEELFEVDELSELKGESINFRILVEKAMGVPVKYSKDVCVGYKFFSDDQEFRSPPCPHTTINPHLKSLRDINIDSVDDDLIEYIRDGVLEISLWGRPPDKDPNATPTTKQAKSPAAASPSPAASSAPSPVPSQLQPQTQLIPIVASSGRPLTALWNDVHQLIDPTITDPERVVTRLREIMIERKEMQQNMETKRNKMAVMEMVEKDLRTQLESGSRKWQRAEKALEEAETLSKRSKDQKQKEMAVQIDQLREELKEWQKLTTSTGIKASASPSDQLNHVRKLLAEREQLSKTVASHASAEAELDKKHDALLKQVATLSEALEQEQQKAKNAASTPPPATHTSRFSTSSDGDMAAEMERIKKELASANRKLTRLSASDASKTSSTSTSPFPIMPAADGTTMILRTGTGSTKGNKPIIIQNGKTITNKEEVKEQEQQKEEMVSGDAKDVEAVTSPQQKGKRTSVNGAGPDGSKACVML